MVNCPNCGVLVEKDSKFCQECGTKIDNSDSNRLFDSFNTFNFCTFRMV